MKTRDKKKKSNVPKIIIISLIVISVVVLAVIGVNAAQTRQDIESFLSILLDQSSSSFEVTEQNKATVREYAEHNYFKNAILTQIKACQNKKSTQDVYNWDGVNDAILFVHKLEQLGYSDPDIYSTLLQSATEELSNYVTTAVDMEFSVYGDFEDALRIVRNLNMLNCDTADIGSSLMQFTMDEMSRSIELNNFSETAKIIGVLEELDIHNEDIKAKFLPYFYDTRTAVFSGNGPITMYDYIVTVNSRLNGSYYVTLIECYPYDEMIAYTEKNGDLVIAQDGLGGYYDNLHNKYYDQSFWYDPLAEKRLSKGEIGTYQYTETNYLTGDFRVELITVYWYMTEKSDKNNTANATLYYKGDEVSSYYENITQFLGMVNNKNCYRVPLDAEKHMFFILGKDTITVFAKGDLFGIAYQ